MIIDQFKKENQQYFIICFKETIILILQSSVALLQSLFSFNPDIKITFLSSAKESFDQQVRINYIESDKNNYFDEEISNLKRPFLIIQRLNSEIKEIFEIVINCISGYLIKQGYEKLNQDRFINFTPNSQKVKNWTENDYLTIRTLGYGASFSVSLIFQIEKEEFYAIKRPYGVGSEEAKLINRESNNYKRICHPLIPKYYCQVDEKHLIIEFINGRPLDNTKFQNDEDKIIIIYEIMLVIQYLDRKSVV